MYKIFEIKKFFYMKLNSHFFLINIFQHSEYLYSLKSFPDSQNLILCIIFLFKYPHKIFIIYIYICIDGKVNTVQPLIYL